MRFGALFWMQRTDWASLRDAWLAAEAAGFDSLWTEDHLLADLGDWRSPKLEGWATLAALAPLTPRPRLGVMVTAATFRNPGLVAKLATTVDHISGGRLILGLGAGHFQREHEAFGLDFGATPGKRLDRLEEATGLIERLLAGELVTHEGEYYRMVDALCEPRPIQKRIPILIGGAGPQKTLRTAARHADIWNGFGNPQVVAETSAILKERCAEIGRDFDSIERTVTTWGCIRNTVGAANEAHTQVREAYGLALLRPPDGSRVSPFCAGSPGEVAATVRAYETVGIREIMWHFIAPFDRETIERLPEVRAALRASATPA